MSAEDIAKLFALVQHLIDTKRSSTILLPSYLVAHFVT